MVVCQWLLTVTLVPHFRIHHDVACQHVVCSVVQGFPAPPEASHQEDLGGCVVHISGRRVGRSVRADSSTGKGCENQIAFGGSVSGALSSVWSVSSV